MIPLSFVMCVHILILLCSVHVHILTFYFDFFSLHVSAPHPLVSRNMAFIAPTCLNPPRGVSLEFARTSLGGPNRKIDRIVVQLSRSEV